MKCHRHAECDAIAVCSHCTKGLCAECMREVSGRTACGDRCAEALEREERVLLRAERGLDFQVLGPRFVGVFLVVMGLSLAGWGGSRASDFLITTGALMTLAGVVACWFGWRQEGRAGER